MSSGERPIGAAKGTQSDTKALCQPPPPPPPEAQPDPQPTRSHGNTGPSKGINHHSEATARLPLHKSLCRVRSFSSPPPPPTPARSQEALEGATAVLVQYYSHTSDDAGLVIEDHQVGCLCDPGPSS